MGLSINCKVNGHPVIALVSSGAERTLMSQTCAERCNIMHLVEQLPSQPVVATSAYDIVEVIGHAHVQIQVNDVFLPSCVSIVRYFGHLEDRLLLGSDIIIRHQATMDFYRSVLQIGGTETPLFNEDGIFLMQDRQS